MTLDELSALPTAETRLAEARNEIHRRGNIVAAQVDALHHWRKLNDLDAAVINRLRNALSLIARSCPSDADSPFFNSFAASSLALRVSGGASLFENQCRGRNLGKRLRRAHSPHSARRPACTNRTAFSISPSMYSRADPISASVAGTAPLYHQRKRRENPIGWCTSDSRCDPKDFSAPSISARFSASVSLASGCIGR